VLGAQRAQPFDHELVGQAVSAFLRGDTARAQAGGRNQLAAEELVHGYSEAGGHDAAVAQGNPGRGVLTQDGDVGDVVAERAHGQLFVLRPQVVIGFGKDIPVVGDGLHGEGAFRQ
jgi:hypothetical protein